MKRDLKTTFETIMKVFGRKPSEALSTYTAECEWKGNLLVEATMKEFKQLIDEPEMMAGTNQGPSPLDIQMAALGSCQEIMYAAFAAVMGIKLDEVKVKVDGEIDLRGMFGMDGVPAGFKKITYVTTIKSPEPREKLEMLVKAVEANCPVMDTLKRPMDVSGQVIIN
jgi:putative redox protein